jgi:hypothetical protein
MYGGIPEKFPKLRIGVFGTGIGWVPFFMERMDKDFEGRHDEEAPFLRTHRVTTSVAGIGTSPPLMTSNRWLTS